MATRVERLVSIRDNLLRIIDEQTAAWAAAGCPVTFSADGESYAWNEWLSAKMEAVKLLEERIARAQPFYLRSRHRG